MRSKLLFMLFCCVFISTIWIETGCSGDSAGTDVKVSRKNICGVYCLASIFEYLNAGSGYSELSNKLGDPNGTNLARLKNVAESYGLKTLGVQISEDTLFSANAPAILHVNGNHFIAFLPHKAAGMFTVIDPPQRYRLNSPGDLTSRWNWGGNSLFIDNKKINLNNPGITDNAPHIGVDEPVYDAGIVYEDVTVITHTFIIRNTGGGELIITDIKTDCSCTTTDNSKKKLAAGESLDITINFNVKGELDKVLERKTLVFTNDTLNPKTELTIRATRKREFELFPPSASIGVIPVGQGAELLMRIVPSERKRRLDMGKASVSSGFVEVSEINNVDPNGSNIIRNQQIANDPDVTEYKIKVRLLPSVSVGNFEDMVKIPFADDPNRFLEITVLAEVSGPVKVSLSKIHFGLLKRDGKQRTKKISLNAEVPFEILNVTADKDWLKATTVKTSDREFNIIVQVDPSKINTGKNEAHVKIQTDADKMTSIDIPVYLIGM